MTQEQIDPSIVVRDVAVMKLAAYLKEVGRLHGGPNDVRTQLNRAVKGTWGRGVPEQHTDGAGPLWLMDLSDYFEDQMLYAVVRSEHGTRQVVAVVDVDEVENFHATRTWNSPEALGEVDPNQAMTNLQASPSADTNSAPMTMAAPTSDSDPCLIAYWHAPDIGSRQDGDYSNEGRIRCSRSAVAGHIGRLLQEGVEEKNIEVWTGMSKPQVKIAF